MQKCRLALTRKWGILIVADNRGRGRLRPQREVCRDFSWETTRKEKPEEYVADSQTKEQTDSAEETLASEEKIGGAETGAPAGDAGLKGEQQTPAAESAGDLETQLAEARQEAGENYEKLLRLAAEFENYKKRMEREKQNTLKFAEESIIRELLPTIDNLERALELGHQSDDRQALLEGIEMTRKCLLASLEKFGLQQMQSTGEPFDPNFHEALTMEAASETPANHVLKEFQKGYMYKDRLIRAAKVIVSGGGEKKKTN